ncbi:Glycosyl transferase, group 1 [Candidatus Magnetoovum chiemensis]|nr:Glycosyl transferase, group 1 [Candidatus Magnetoovum chiemensis]
MNAIRQKILIYSGHNELVGGDAKYLVDLLNGLDLNKYAIHLYTDVNELFKTRFAPKISNLAIPITYLDTKPTLFKQDFLSKHYGKQHLNTSSKKARRFETILVKFLSFELFNNKIIDYVLYTFRRTKTAMQIYWIRDFIHNFIVFRKMFKLHSSSNYIFHFNNGGYPAKEAGISAMLAAYMQGVRSIIMTIHSTPRKRTLDGYLKDIFLDWIVNRYCNVIISASEFGKTLMAKRRKINPNKLVTIHCGINDINMPEHDTICLLKKELRIKDGITILLAVGHLDWKGKGWDVLFRSLYTLKSKCGDFIALVLGAGSEASKDTYHAQVNKYGLDEHVRFLGYREDVYLFYNVCDIFLAPYTGPEATPYTIKEAMRAAKPVITTSTGGCAEAVVHDKTGLIVRTGSYEELAQAIYKLINNKSLRLEMGEHGRKLFENKFMLELKVKEHELIYDKFKT